MLLAGGIVGVAVPILLQRTTAESELIRVGSGLLLVTIIVGAVFDAMDDRRTTPILIAASKVSRLAAALALAEDAQLISTISGKPDPGAVDMVKAADADVRAAEEPMRKAAEWFANVGVLEATLFYGSFVVGVGFIILAMGVSAG